MRPSLFSPILLGLCLIPACGDKASSDESTSSSATSNGTTTDTDSASTTSTSAPTTSTTDPTTSGPGSTTTTTDPSGTSGPSFVVPPDIPGEVLCNPKTQDCPDGEKCTAWANDGGGFWNANKCVPVDGTGVAGDPCMTEGGGVSGLDNCAEGFICLNADENGVGACIGFCTDDDSCDPGFICAIYNDGVLPICLDECHPLLQDCPNGQSCIDTPNGNFICFTDASGTAGLDGDPCPPADGENSCDPGMWCGAGSSGCNDPKCCTPYCDVTGADDCTAPDVCTSFYGDPNSGPPMYQDVGVCVAP